MSEIHLGDVGTTFIVTVTNSSGGALAISNATVKELTFQRPDSTALTKAADFVNDGNDGKIKYTTITGDLSMTGSWKIQAHIVTPMGGWRTSTANFTVLPNL